MIAENNVQKMINAFDGAETSQNTQHTTRQLAITQYSKHSNPATSKYTPCSQTKKQNYV